MKKQLLSIALSLTLIVQTFPALGSTTIQGNNTFNAISTNLSNETEYKAGNPIITNIFTADPSAHVWEENGRIYIYASHDMMPAKGCGNMDKYHVYSSDNMVTWKDEGEILSAADVSWGRSKGGLMWAPDAAHVDDTYYFYFPHPTGNDDWNSTWRIGVATSKKPTSDFTCKDDGYVKMKDGSPCVTKIDPCIFKDDDGSYYLYTGGGSKCYVAKLSSDMQTLAEDPVEIDETLDDFHEGMWVFKRNEIYYAMYADNTSGHNLMRYSTSNSPYGPFKDGGVILDATSCDTTHGSIVEYKNHWYMFYHNSDLSGRGNLRSVCVDEVFFNEDGSIQKVNQTKDGVSAVGPVDPNEYESLHKTYDESEFVEKTDYGLTNVEVKNANFNGKTISGFHVDNATATWSNINGGKGGKALITVTYATPESAVALVNTTADTANTGYFLRFDPTTAWNDYTGVATCIVDLNPGTNNTIKLTGSMGGVNINGFSVSLLDQTIPETTTTAPATTVPPTTTPTTAPTITPKATTENPGTSQTTSATESSSLESVTSTSSNVTSDVVTSIDENASSDVVTSSSENVSSDIATSDNESVYSNVTTKTDKATSKIVVKKSKVKKAVKKRKAAKIKITLKKVFKAKYLVKVSTSKKFSKKKTVTKIVKKASFVFKNKRFRNKKKLYVKVRALKKVDNTIIYSKWSKPKKIKLK